MDARSAFFAELKRRHVSRAAVAYLLAAWVLLQLGSILLPAFDAPPWTMRALFGLLSLGFPITVIFAWAFEITPDGMRRTAPAHADDARSPEQTRRIGRYLNATIIAVLAVAVGVLTWRQFGYSPSARALAQSAPPAAGISPAIPEKSVAVLPFVNESGNKNEQYFSDGLSEDLITALSQFAGLKVISRHSSFRFRNSQDGSEAIGAKLGVAHLLEGSVRRVGDDVRVSAELVNAADGRTLWSRHYDRPYKDLFKLQDAITDAVAAALKAKLLTSGQAVAQTDRPPGGDILAWQAYQQGKFYFDRDTETDFHLAVGQFTAAARRDPHYAAAYAALAHVWANLGARYLDGTAQRHAYAEAQAAVTQALALAPDLAAAHRARGYLLINANLDWRGAQADYGRALQLAPNNRDTMFAVGNLYAALGQPRRAVALTRNALAADPLHAVWYVWLGHYLAALGDTTAAEQAVRQAIALQPAADTYYEELAAIAVQQGDAGAALAAAQQEPSKAWRAVALALVRQIGPDRAAADAALQHLVDEYAKLAPYQIAEVYAVRREPDRMFAWLERAWANRDPGIAYLLFDPFMLRYAHDPRFAAFCNKAGLPAPGAKPIGVAITLSDARRSR